MIRAAFDSVPVDAQTDNSYLKKVAKIVTEAEAELVDEDSSEM